MKIYTFGAEDAPVLLLLPGTCCHWKSNFGAVIPLLADSFRVLCVSYDGFDETEQTEFPTMLEETEKIEAYLKTHCGGRIWVAYGCSLGGSFVGLLAARQNIHMDYGILGSSDLDQASPLAASLQTDFLLPLIYPVVRDGKIEVKFLQKRLDKRAKESGEYLKAFLKMFGDARPYVTMQSCKNQFYSDLIGAYVFLEQARTRKISWGCVLIPKKFKTVCEATLSLGRLFRKKNPALPFGSAIFYFSQSCFPF